MSRRLVAACLLSLASAAVARADSTTRGQSRPSSAGTHSNPASTFTHYLDGALSMRAERLEDGWARITSSDGGDYRARLNARAILRVTSGDPAAYFANLGVRVDRALVPALGLWLVHDAGGADGLALASRLGPEVRAGRLLAAVPDLEIPRRKLDISVPPNDARYPGQWFLERLGMEEAWRIEDGDPETTIVIVDDGCDLAHPDLAPQLDQGRDVLERDDEPSYTPSTRGNNHGTACAGVAAAATDNTIGIAGACPGCRLRCVRLLDASGAPIPISSDVDAFNFAFDVGADIVSNSWGFEELVPTPGPLRAAIERLIDQGRGGLGALVLFAAGNDNREIDEREVQAVRGVLTIGATNNFDEATAFSNRGATLDVVAPTGSFTTDISGPDGDDPGDYFGSFGGTSSACPLVAGVVGLMVSAKPEATGVEISDALLESARPSTFGTPDGDGHDLLYGYGRVEPARALRRLLGVVEPGSDAGVVDAGPADAGITSEPPAEGGCAVARAHSPRDTSISFAFSVLAGACAMRWRIRRGRGATSSLRRSPRCR